MIQALLLIILFPAVTYAKGGPLTFFEFSYLRQSFTADEAYSATGLTTDLRMSISFFSSSNFYISFGGSYSSLAGNLTADDTYQLNTLKPYFGVEYFNLGKPGLNFGVFYAPLSIAYFQNSNQTEQETWNGSGYFARVAYTGKLTSESGIMIGFRYDSNRFSTKSSDSFTAADQLSQSLISPFLGYYLGW